MTALTYALKTLVEQFRIGDMALTLPAAAQPETPSSRNGGDITLF